VRADIQRYYPGRRLEEFWALSWGEGSMSWAELRDLVDALPEDSATKAAMAGDVEGRRWSQATYLQAAQYNALILLIRLAWMGWQFKGKPPDLKAAEPPRLVEDEEVAAAKAAKAAKARAVLDSLSPPRVPGPAPVDVEEWRARIAALEQ
jgi:hypothetical protein